MFQMSLKTGDLDLNLEGQIGLETKTFCVIPCECNNFCECRKRPSLVFSMLRLTLCVLFMGRVFLYYY